MEAPFEEGQDPKGQQCHTWMDEKGKRQHKA